MSAPSHVVFVSVGNTRTRFGVGSLGQGLAGGLGGGAAGELEPSRVLENSSVGAIAEAIAEEADRADAPLVLLASVNSAVADRLARELEGTGQLRVQRFGEDVEIPIAVALKDAETVGQDRLLNALGAYSRSKQACIVIDAGTAVTVDFVDGEGTFQGGAIAPGVRMMREALHTQTAALPRAEISAEKLHEKGEAPFGKDTVEAINLGVTSAVVGLAHHLIDRYAEFYEAYPRVVATGGDAPFLFEHDALVEQIVPDLTLVGMLAAWELLAAGAGDGGDE